MSLALGNGFLKVLFAILFDLLLLLFTDVIWVFNSIVFEVRIDQFCRNLA